MKKRLQLIIFILATLTACGGDEDKTVLKGDIKKEVDKLSSSQKKEVNEGIAKVMKEKKKEALKKQESASAGKTILDEMVASDLLTCTSQSMRKGYPDGIKGEASVTYSGKLTPSLLDDSVYSVSYSHFSNSQSKMRDGDPLEFVKYTRHVLINAEGRYQWIENPAETLEKVKAMSSLQDGLAMRHVEKELAPSFFPASLVQQKYNNEERGRFLYGFKVWVENMLEKSDPTEAIKSCSIPEAFPDISPPELDYMTFEKIYEKDYSKSKDPKEHNIKMAKSQLSSYRDAIKFPPYVLYGSRPAWVPNPK